MLDKQIIINSYERIKPFINDTPILTSHELNNLIGHEVFFKAENVQVTGAFKIRGVLNTILTLKEQGKLPKKLVAYSSGNHAKALAWAGANIAKISTEIYMHKSASLSKRQAIKDLGANLIITETRAEAENLAKARGMEQDNYFMHPSDNDLVIAGAATLGYEIARDFKEIPDAVFAACGGGALLSGLYIGMQAMNFKTKIYGCEPSIANDASNSYKLGKIVGFSESPQTIADGLRTLKVSERTFKYLQKLDGFVEAQEEEIIYWFYWINKFINTPCEPTAALTMAAAVNWLKTQNKGQRILVVLSGGNMDEEVKELLKDKIWENNPPENIFYS